MNIHLLLLPVLSCVLAYVLAAPAIHLATKLHLTDKPNSRKVHTSAVPLVGGLLIFAASWVSTLLFLSESQEMDFIKNLFISSIIMMTVGSVDDRYDLRASIRLAIQVMLAHYMFCAGVRIESFYGVLGIEELSYGLQYTTTVLVITGVINAFNLMDGIDGLAGSLGLISSLTIACIAIATGQTATALIFLAIGGSLVTFLIFNLSSTQKIFMGDAGSMTMGFMISVAGISLLPTSSAGPQYSWIFTLMVSMLLIPVLDALRVFRQRIKAGRSPFDADKTHLHHLVLVLGLKHKTTTAILTLSALLIMLIGYLIDTIAGVTWSIVIMTVVFYGATAALRFHNEVILWRNEIRIMERKF